MKFTKYSLVFYYYNLEVVTFTPYNIAYANRAAHACHVNDCYISFRHFSIGIYLMLA
jgi:hypothetical protein